MSIKQLKWLYDTHHIKKGPIVVCVWERVVKYVGFTADLTTSGQTHLLKFTMDLIKPQNKFCETKLFEVTKESFQL